ncbi:mitochondrial matrix Mmp37 [Pseudovirgaria hyperparasitica]|uniref:Phosphatidate cytidylyltransferase, mitochondrial n=1 Tax=Pseudovirgaria hyperparasitica TaxID=470096 RepID=A0A6A6W4C2_9PEZI|nr:mitochondrial matrix Mmp37 [Pseudovirgaria hyperparasitica]KAF2757778.1 mitochondrial matrix Mmp37 [Pseudovirgaria hyperparasitica]
MPHHVRYIMSLPTPVTPRSSQAVIAWRRVVVSHSVCYPRYQLEPRRLFASRVSSHKSSRDSRSYSQSSSSRTSSIKSESSLSTAQSPTQSSPSSQYPDTSGETSSDWEDGEHKELESFGQLPSKDFGQNQVMETNEEFKKSLRQILRNFPQITHAFAYGSGVFPQSEGNASRVDLSPHPNPPEAILKWQKGGGKVIDFILATKFSQHFHSLNLNKHRDHYSFLGSLGSGAVSYVQDKFGAGAYYNPYITINGTLIKYGVVQMDTLYRDLTEWDTLYLAGRLQKPVKILTEDPNIRLANQRNLMAAVRCALLMLPETFTEHDLYTTIASLSYTGDPRMNVGSEHPNKIQNIVTHQLRAFRQLYSSLIYELPNIHYDDKRLKSSNPRWETLPLVSDFKMTQIMEPAFRGNMVRRLPKSFREKLYFQYQKKFSIPGAEFTAMLESSKDEDARGGVRKPVGGPFDQKISMESDIAEKVRASVVQTVKWPSTVQSVKGIFTGGLRKSWRYTSEKWQKGKLGQTSS